VSTGPGGKVNRSGFSRFRLLANETADEHLSRPAGALPIKVNCFHALTALALVQPLSDSFGNWWRFYVETLERIVEWLSARSQESPLEPGDEVIFEIDTLEDAARIAMG